MANSFITPQEFRALLDLQMVSDPWPLPQPHQAIVSNMLYRLASEARPGACWIDAYHYYHPDRFGRIWWLAQIELCKECGQPDNCGDCNHERIEDVSAFAGSFV